MHIKNIFTIVLSTLILSGLYSQQTDNSPYSRFGIGDLADNNFNHTRQMGGLGASFLDGYHINIVNPASYSFLNATAFDVGVFSKRTLLEDKKNKTKIWSGNLEYLSLAFPLRNPINEIYDGTKKDYKLGMAITLMPHSNVSYNIISQDSITGAGAFSRNYVGTGGTYKLLWGNSIKYKNLSFGVNMGYLFGQVKYERKLIFGSNAFAYSNFLTNDYNIRGFLWNTGFMYSTIINNEALKKNKSLSVKRISIGIHGNSSTNFNSTYNFNEQLIQQLPANIFNVDTIRLESGVEGNGKLPSEFGAGITYLQGEKSAIGINYTYSGWSNYFNDATSDKQGDLRNSSRFAVGGYYRPNYKSFDNFFERVYYRYGLYYNNDPRAINNEQITSYGITMGLGMPLVYQRKVSHINLGVNFGVRGQNTPISERYVKISAGVTFNDDEWFLKRKYN